MSASSIVVMIIGMVILWGGLAASIWNAFRKQKDTN
ncbi:methionine/alanine import family NSS transporter small subunit [Oceanobacillus luteolus]|uniref:Methionine/alanine import family NSS transporter small subunit n=1 Tax=Oceanobacillus luteolus TaxID=1274358 RepID=A0ABW4HUB9_9BACI|nr:methionine/alanine import family NSS transporter small subunit [Oceanobacillus luteolus]MCM3739344.1 methionine/alanine import family NSS transporter small subunit [Oceanobacillus luteolus]